MWWYDEPDALAMPVSDAEGLATPVPEASWGAASTLVHARRRERATNLVLANIVVGWWVKR